MPLRVKSSLKFVDKGGLKRREDEMATSISSTQLLGAQLLKEIGNEEGSLEDVSLQIA